MPLTPTAHSLDLQPFLGPALVTETIALSRSDNVLTWYALIGISLGYLLQTLTRMATATFQIARHNLAFTNLEQRFSTPACFKQQVIQKRCSKMTLLKNQKEQLTKKRSSSRKTAPVTCD